MDDDNHSHYEGILTIIRRIRGTTGHELQQAISTLTKRTDRILSDESDLQNFIEWLKNHKDFSENPDSANALITEVKDSLPEDHVFKNLVNKYNEKVEAQEKENDVRSTLNDICIFLREAKKNKTAGQKEVAKTFTEQADNLLRAHPEINAQVIEKYQKERYDALLKLFQKADVIAKATSLNERATLENEFTEIGQKYGFLIQNSDGSAATTDEFNEEYELYLQDPKAYLKKNSKAQSTASHHASQAAFADASDDDGLESDEVEQEPDDIPEPEPPPVTHVDLFPVRDANGKMSAFVPADSYSAALNAYISTHAPKDSLSLSVDFEAESLDHKADTVSITQHDHLEGWSLSAKELSWTSSTPEATAKGVSIKTDKGNIDIGITDGLTAEIGEGSVNAQASINGSNITINKGDMTAVGTAADTKIILKSGSVLASGDVERSEITLEGEGRVEVKGSAQDTEIKLSTKSTAIFRGNISGGSVQTESGVCFSNQSVKAQGTTFTGHIPSSPNLQPSDFQRAQNEDRRKHAPRIVQMMPELLYQAFGLGRPDTQGSKFAKILWNSRAIKLSSSESEFISDMLFALDNGFDTSLLSIAGNKSERTKKVSELQAFLQKARDEKQNITLLVYPYLKNKKQDTALHNNADSVEGEYHYRFAFVTGKHTNAPYRNDHDLFESGCDNGGYPEKFWNNIQKEYKPALFLDISTPKATDQLSTLDASLTLSGQLEDRIAEAKWLMGSDRLFSNVCYNPTEGVRTDDNKVVLPCRRYHNEGRDLRDKQRPLHAQAVSALKDVTVEISKDFEAIPVIRSSVFEDCRFTGLSTDFYSDGLSGITLSKVKGRGYVEGDLSKTAYKKESQVGFACISDVSLKASRVKGNSTLTLSKFDAGGANIKIDADEISVTESNFEVFLGSKDKISLKDAKFKKAKIKITSVKKVDFSNAEFEDCEIIISSVNKVAFNSASFTSCKITVEGEKVDFSESSVSGQNNVIDLKTKSAVFKGSTIGGSTELKGKADSAEFEETKIGDDVTSSDDKVSYGLQSDQNTFDHAEFGNVLFLNTSKTQTKTTDWTTAKVTGRVSAAGEIAQVLYPLFAEASNMSEETKPAQQAGNRAHPSRRFALDCVISNS